MPNPIDDLLGGVGSAIGDAAASGANAVMKEVWSFAVGLLAGSLNWIDELGAPNVDAAGPMAGVLPTILWVGLVVLVILSFVQIGRSVLDGGKGFVTLLTGIAQYAVITAGGLGFLAALVTAADALALGLLKGGLKIDNWQGITGHNSVLANAAHGLGGIGLGVIALFLLIPTVIGLIVETLIRQASIVFLAATIPLIAAGLVQESTTRWFWTAWRWMIALLLLTPAIALVMVLGLRIAAGAAGADGASQGGGQASVQVVVSGVVMLISLMCPMALFKLFAFIDPGTVSGARMRGFFAGGGVTSGGGAPATEGGEVGGSENATASRFSDALSAGSSALRGAASDAATTGASMLDTVGAGHQGTPAAGGGSKKKLGRHGTEGEDAPDGGQDETAHQGDGVAGTPPTPQSGGAMSDAPAPRAAESGEAIDSDAASGTAVPASAPASSPGGQLPSTQGGTAPAGGAGADAASAAAKGTEVAEVAEAAAVVVVL